MKLIATNVKSFTHKLYYPVAFDSFLECLKLLAAFIQGPNEENQQILVDGEFVELAHEILLMEYTDKSSKSHQKEILRKIKT